ncbi:MAG: hypothetical protein ABI968_08110 [Acidobacteriota bacterium]
MALLDLAGEAKNPRSLYRGLFQRKEEQLSFQQSACPIGISLCPIDVFVVLNLDYGKTFCYFGNQP